MSYRTLNHTTEEEDVILEREGDDCPAILNIVVRLDGMIDGLRVANRAMAGNREDLVNADLKQKREIEDLTNRLTDAQDALQRTQT